MQEELRRSNSIGNPEGVDTFLSLIFAQRLSSVKALNHACRFLLFYQLNCRLALLLLEDLGLISVTKDCITVLPEGGRFFELSQSETKKQIAEITINKLFEENLLEQKKLGIDNATGILQIPASAIHFDATIYVTFLQTIGCFRRVGAFFVFDDDSLREDFEKKVVQRKRKISQDELLLNLQKKQADGDTGEQFVVGFEKQRLAGCPLTPKRISVIDVSAGYDILSCNNSDSSTYDRYIEVKSFRGSPHFYWSSNEKRVAELLGENYFLYLVDLSAVEQGKENYAPQIIANPAVNLCSDDWLIEPDSYRITSLK